MNRQFLLVVLLIIAACNAKPKTKPVKSERVNKEITTGVPCCSAHSASSAGFSESKEIKLLIVSVDSVQKNPEKYFDKTIGLQGRVIHTCKESGKKMFLCGSDDQNLIRINAGDNISRFDESLQGEIVIAKGVLTPVKEVVAEKAKHEKTTCATEGKAKQYVLACTEFEVILKN